MSGGQAQGVCEGICSLMVAVLGDTGGPRRQGADIAAVRHPFHVRPRPHPAKSKLHLATPDGTDEPLDVFFAGDFEAWQSRQSKKNFEGDFIGSLIKLPGLDRWFFAGCCTSSS